MDVTPSQVQEIGTRVQDALNIYRGQSQEEAAQAATLIRGLDQTMPDFEGMLRGFMAPAKQTVRGRRPQEM